MIGKDLIFMWVLWVIVKLLVWENFFVINVEFILLRLILLYFFGMLVFNKLSFLVFFKRWIEWLNLCCFKYLSFGRILFIIKFFVVFVIILCLDEKFFGVNIWLIVILFIKKLLFLIVFFIVFFMKIFFFIFLWVVFFFLKEVGFFFFYKFLLFLFFVLVVFCFEWIVFIFFII